MNSLAERSCKVACALHVCRVRADGGAEAVAVVLRLMPSLFAAPSRRVEGEEEGGVDRGRRNAPVCAWIAHERADEVGEGGFAWQREYR